MNKEIRYADLDGNGTEEAFVSFHVHSCNPRSHTIVYEMQNAAGCPLRELGTIEHSGSTELAGKLLRASYDACATCMSNGIGAASGRAAGRLREIVRATSTLRGARAA